MKLDWFSQSVFTAESDMDDKAKGLLETHAEMFLRAQGGLSWNEWQLLSPDSQASFVKAGDKLKDEMAKTIASQLIEETEKEGETI